MAVPPTPRDPFDLAKVRRNFERALVPEPATMPAVIARVRAARDPFPTAREDVVRLRAAVTARFPGDTEALIPFLERIEGRLIRMETPSGESDDGKDRDAIREEFHSALADLEDLLEVFAFVRR